MEQYKQRIEDILNEASKDSGLSKEDYKQLCVEISDEAENRIEAVDADDSLKSGE